MAQVFYELEFVNEALREDFLEEAERSGVSPDQYAKRLMLEGLAEIESEGVDHDAR